MRLFEFTGIPLNPNDQQNVLPQYSYNDLRPYIPSPEEEARYNRSLRPYRMFPEPSLDERFADLKKRLAEAIDKRAKFHANQARC